VNWTDVEEIEELSHWRDLDLLTGYVTWHWTSKSESGAEYTRKT